MAYVYRYAGMLEQSTKECDTALALDPGNYIYRSCAWAFMELGKTERAADFIRLDAGSEWAAYVTPSLLLREGKIAEARGSHQADANRSSLSPRSAGGLRAAPTSLWNWTTSPMRPISTCRSSPIPSSCTTREPFSDIAARTRLPCVCSRAPSSGTICAYSNLLHDPLLEKLRADPGFNKVLTSAKQCLED